MSATTPPIGQINATVRYGPVNATIRDTVTGWFAKYGNPVHAHYIGLLAIAPALAYLDGDDVDLHRAGEAHPFASLHLSSVEYADCDEDLLTLGLISGDLLEVWPEARYTASA